MVFKYKAYYIIYLIFWAIAMLILYLYNFHCKYNTSVASCDYMQ